MKSPPDSYFLIKFKVDKEKFEYGPYLHIDDATHLLVSHIPFIAEAKALKKKYNYMAEVHECVINEKGTWDTISIPITENLCRKQKH
tara:strand:- start:281 stop:541 length:261 start_codon:yes stop_codon:yes gene_type:complete